MTEDSHFQQLLSIAATQAQPHRLLFVFAAAELPDHPTEAQREAFAAGRGGALAPRMCVDKGVGELKDFAGLAAESKTAGPPWQVVFAAALPGLNGLAPTKAEIDAALKTMVETLRVGGVDKYAAFDQDGEPLRLR
ncbi:ribonucleotide reductase subunit alpha [Caulobacter sp.]|uniref:ribonucleotide reductase subunit alpha n=1 Tax=Caulobacter sp. TaxID=78 RepID=UPI003BAE26FA